MSVRSPHSFIVGIGGSGMLPLALLLLQKGHLVSGSDRSYDQGLTPDKFAWLKAQGISLYAQDGSGIAQKPDTVVISKAVEETVPDLAAARAAGLKVRQRADLLMDLFNAAPLPIAIAGTSGKTTTTGLCGFLFRELDQHPTLLNGGIVRNDAASSPYATAFAGKGPAFICEIDESDGPEMMARYRPAIALLHNLTLDHQPMDVLVPMFQTFLGNAQKIIVNADDTGASRLNLKGRKADLTYGLENEADLKATNVKLHADGSSSQIYLRGEKAGLLDLQLPGKHNLSNALAALAVCVVVGFELKEALKIVPRFEGIKRRLERVGKKNGITVFDDFAHNPDKIRATLQTLKSFEGRLIVFFQPHGYGFLKLLGDEVADSFSSLLSSDDLLLMVEPFYAGGTVDRAVTSEMLANKIRESDRTVHVLDDRAAIKAEILSHARPGDRIVIMGARDDTLSAFALDVLNTL